MGFDRESFVPDCTSFHFSSYLKRFGSMAFFNLIALNEIKMILKLDTDYFLIILYFFVFWNTNDKVQTGTNKIQPYIIYYIIYFFL